MGPPLQPLCGAAHLPPPAPSSRALAAFRSLCCSSFLRDTCSRFLSFSPAHTCTHVHTRAHTLPAFSLASVAVLWIPFLLSFPFSVSLRSAVT